MHFMAVLQFTLFGESVTLAWVLLNMAYLVYVASSACKQMVTLRVVLIIATVFFIAYGITDDIWSVVWWNLPFGFMHGWQLAKLIAERRRTALTEEQEAIRTLLLPSLDPVEFARLWKLGHERSLGDNEELIAEGSVAKALMLVLDGAVEVRFNADEGHRAVRLGRLSLLGEMSVITGEPASASVFTTGRVRLQCWPRDALIPLDDLQAAEPKVHSALMGMVGRDLVNKLR